MHAVDFQTLPPKPLMMQILDATSKIYVFLWDRKDETNTLRMTWKKLSKYFNKNRLKTGLRKLCDEGLLDYRETASGICVELVSLDDLE